MIDIGVYVLFFNKVDQTIECINSFISANIPIYILDNGSTSVDAQKLKDFIIKYPNIFYFSENKNYGVGPGRNYLIKKTTHEWLFFVDNDIIINTTDWTKLIYNHIKKDNNCQIFVPRIYNIREGEYTIVCDLKIDNNELKIIKSDNLYTNWFMGGGSIVNRKVYDVNGFYDEHMKVGFEDYEFALRAMKNDFEIKAKNIFDIELIHDHRYSPKKSDKKATQVRYDYELQNMSAQRLMDLYGIKFDGYKDWLTLQKLQITNKHYSKFKLYFDLKRKFVRFYGKAFR